MGFIICKPSGVCHGNPLTPPIVDHGGYYGIEHGWHDAMGLRSIHSIKVLGCHGV